MGNRSAQVKKNIVYSVILKAVSVGLSFLLLPLTVHYLSEIEYGIWVTLLSVMNWVNFLDMGLGLGLRNKLAAAVAADNREEIRSYMTTGFVAMGLLGGILLVLFLLLLPRIPLQQLFNTTVLSETELYAVTLWTGIFVLAAFVLSTINQVYYAYQRAAVTGAIQIAHSAVMLAVVYYLTLQPTHELLYFVFSFGIATLTSRLLFIADFFRQHRDVLPRLRYFSLQRVKSITGLGIQFFIIQICCLIGYSFSDFLITQLLGPEYVRTYDIVFKIFNFSIMLYSLILAPTWSAYTEAFVQQDYTWIWRTFRRTLYVSGIVGLGLIPVGYFIDTLVWLWLHIHLEYSIWLIVGMWLYHCLYMVHNACCMVLNGIGRLHVQIVAWILAAASVVPLAWGLTQWLGMQTEGIILALCLSMLPLITMLPLHLAYIAREWRHQAGQIT